MQCTLLVPELFWNGNAADAVRGLALPALESLLARGRTERHAPLAREAWLCQAFEVERQQDWPVAPLTLELDGGDPAGMYWLRADPVHFQLQRDRVALMASDTLNLTRDEADACAAALNEAFSADGYTFEARALLRWYVRLPHPPALVTQTISMAAGRNVRDVLPSGADAPAWRRVLNEVQMLLHDTLVNRAREAAGLPAVNSVWFWGGGIKTDVPGRAFDAVWADDALAQALGARADAHAAPLPADANAWLHAARQLPATRHLIVVDDCSNGVMYGDMAGWRDAVSRVEHAWAAPLAAALKDRALEQLAVAVPGATATWRFEIRPRSFYRFWARPRPLSAYARP